MDVSQFYPSVYTIHLSNPSINRGGHYNITSGEYTCPVTGIYFFSLTLGGALEIGAGIRTENGYLLRLGRVSPDGYIILSSSALYGCTIGEKIFLEAFRYTTLSNWRNNNVFSGFLII